ncbi:MAG: pyruvate synthase [Pseudomonadota bacterium]
MSRQLLTGNGAAAWGARLADVDYIPAFPITPQTEIIETLSGWIDKGEMAARLTMLESEHSMLTAAGAASVTGVRVFTATSSQGLLYGMEMLYNVAGWRAPLVLVNVSRGLGAPLTLESDHSDIMATRDAGLPVIFCATCQEVLDAVLIAHRLAEHKNVRLPVIVNLDGFYLSFTREPVTIPDAAAVRRFLPPFDPENIEFRASRPVSQAVAVLGGSPYSYFRYEMHLAMQQALPAYDEIAADFASAFGRSWPTVETYKMDDAEFAYFMVGAFATKAMAAVDRLRAEGWKIGLVRPRLMRPYPLEILRKLLLGKQGVAVIDQNLSLGKGGVLYTELASALYGQPGAPLLASFVGGLGGRDIPAEEFYEMARVLQAAVKAGQAPEPRLLYTRTELREFKKLQAIAVVERREIGGEK